MFGAIYIYVYLCMKHQFTNTSLSFVTLTKIIKDISSCLGMNIKQTYLMLKQVLPIEVGAKDEKIIQLLKLLRLPNKNLHLYWQTSIKHICFQKAVFLTSAVKLKLFLGFMTKDQLILKCSFGVTKSPEKPTNFF